MIFLCSLCFLLFKCREGVLSWLVSLQEEQLMAEPEGKPSEPTKEELKAALKAFRKRLRLTQLDDESRLGYGPMTKGGQSGVIAITPPDQYPKEIWQELAKQGKLKHVGHGLYELLVP
jgi:hypothetical protein